MREIKFRAWCESGRYWNVTWQDLARASDEGKIIWEMFLNPDWIIEQYTGLKDKNDKEIYEGDILDEDDGPAIVVFHDSSWALEMSDEDEAAIEPFSVYIIDNMEVIGNIHDNPELLP